jgi:hypothetical protein
MRDVGEVTEANKTMDKVSTDIFRQTSGSIDVLWAVAYSKKALPKTPACHGE